MIRSALVLALFSLSVTVGPAHTAWADGHMDRPAPKSGGADELPPETEFFDEHDANADGFVTTDEYPFSSESFRLLDKDKDGKISTTDLGLPADYRPDPKAKAKRDAVRAREERGDGARGMRDRIRKQIEKMDKNGDKAISREEWVGRPEQFDRLDQNKDGVLDQKDRQQSDRARGGRNAKKMFGNLDKNEDGKLTEDEVPAPRLMRADADGDGSVSFKEFKAVVDRMAGGNTKGRQRGRGVTKAQIQRFDKDDDGKVSREEFPGRDQMFERLDANKDGFLSTDDIIKKDRTKKRDPKTDDGTKKPVTTESASLIKSHDKDGDGKLNRAEFSGSDETWKQLDKNGDGWVTADEVGEAGK